MASDSQASAVAVDRPLVVVASSARGRSQSPESRRNRPAQDYVLLGELFDSIDIDPDIAVRTRFDRLVARRLGASWVVGYRAVLAAKGRRVIITMSDDVGVPAAVFKRLLRSKAPLVILCWHMRSKRAKLLVGRLRFHRAIDCLWSSSSALKQVMIDEYGVPAAKIEIDCMQIDPDFFTADPARPVRRQVASAGMADRDYRTLVAATSGLDVDVVIEANSAWFQQPLNIAPEDLHERVVLSNDGTTIGLRTIYDESAVVVVPLQDVDHAAGYNSILEGMSMEKPVIVSAIEMVGDFIEDGVNGILVPPCDPAALRAKIVEVLDDPERAHTLGTAGRRTVVDRFSLARYGERISRIVGDLTAARQARR